MKVLGKRLGNCYYCGKELDLSSLKMTANGRNGSDVRIVCKEHRFTLNKVKRKLIKKEKYGG
jgi:hypothetical protein